MKNKLLVLLMLVVIAGAILHFRLGYSFEKILPVFAAIAAGMFFCDLDTPLYFLRKQLALIVILAMLAFFGALYYFYGENLMVACPVSGVILCQGGYFFIALVISALVSHFFDVITPFKQGPLHGILPSLAFALFILVAFTLYFELEIGVIGAVLSFFASIVHIFLDMEKNV